MNIQPVDKLKLLSRIQQLRNDRQLQNVFDLTHCGKRRCLRQCWVRNWILERPLFGQYELLIDQLVNYDNHKGFYSVVMSALVDADYRFMWIDVGIMESVLIPS